MSNLLGNRLLTKIEEAMEEHSVFVCVLNFSDSIYINSSHVLASFLSLKFINCKLTMIDSQEIYQVLILLDIKISSLDTFSQFCDAILFGR